MSILCDTCCRLSHYIAHTNRLFSYLLCFVLLYVRSYADRRQQQTSNWVHAVEYGAHPS
ncbi:hypothetical protein K457DRAFT_143001 [Linnemannia elongata AG-77]|uniref:Uncharacterized protein n=1 Tax=Linnemannia elongata AG-77 TaxID=1314771 RepID=A0A197JD96_9FUNG|nr:hypothetical protein K457DRAFT_143001 [Linnemannia elongata AG-77]